MELKVSNIWWNIVFSLYTKPGLYRPIPFDWTTYNILLWNLNQIIRLKHFESFSFEPTQNDSSISYQSSKVYHIMEDYAAYM